MASSKAKTESTLADLGIGIISERFPSLMNNYLGTELLQKNEQSTRAAAIMGFRIGNEFVYIPLLFLNGRIKGTEMLYLADSDTFCSASKQWIEYLSSKNPGAVGEGSDAAPLPMPMPHQLQIFRNVPGAGKMASLFEGAAKDLWEKIASIDQAQDLPKRAEFNFPNVLRSLGPDAYANFMSQVADNPELLEKIAHHYDMNELMPTFPPTATVAKEAQQDTPQPKLEFVTIEELMAGDPKTASLSVEDREYCMTHGFVVMDKRAAEEKTMTVKEDYRSRFSAPRTSGYYEMISRTGKLEKVFIATQAFLIEHQQVTFPQPIILDVESGLYYLPGGVEEVFIRQKMNAEESENQTKDITSGMSEVSSMAVNKSYMLVSPDGTRVSAPFRVENKVSDDGTTSFTCRSPYDIAYRAENPPSLPSFPLTGGYSDVTVRIVDREDSYNEIQKIGSIVFIPKSWKVVEVDPSCGDHFCCSSDDDETKAQKQKRRQTLERITPGNQSTINAALQSKGMFTLNLEKQGSYVVIGVGGNNTEPLNKVAAMRCLTEGIGMSMEDAMDTWNDVTENSKTKRYCKQAEEDKSLLPEDNKVNDDLFGKGEKQDGQSKTDDESATDKVKPADQPGMDSGKENAEKAPEKSKLAELRDVILHTGTTPQQRQNIRNDWAMMDAGMSLEAVKAHRAAEAAKAPAATKPAVPAPKPAAPVAKPAAVPAKK